MHLERQRLPHALLEPCAGDGAISTLLQRAGYDVVASDIRDHGLPGCQLAITSSSCRRLELREW